MDLTLMQAWQLWLLGTDLHDHTMYGVKMLWWGRGGSILGAASGMTILAEVVGFERIAAFSDRLNASIDAISFRPVLAGWRAWNRAWQGYLFADAGSAREKELEIEAEKHSALMIANSVGALALTIVAYLLYFRGTAWYLFVPVLLLVFGLLGAFIVPFLIALALVVTSGLVRGFDLLVVEPLCFLTSRSRIAGVVRLLSIVLLLVGFHFDLLAS
jgi:hypothetical protein